MPINMQYCLLDGFLYQIFFSLYQILMSLMFIFSKARSGGCNAYIQMFLKDQELVIFCLQGCIHVVIFLKCMYITVLFYRDTALGVEVGLGF